MLDDGTGYSGWHDRHTVGGPGVWQDNLYHDPTKYTHQIDDRKEIVDWGEMLGAAVADNHAKMVEQIKADGGKSYDLRDHQEIDRAYQEFFDKWGFRSAFADNDAFYRDLGNKQYEFWGRVIEAARLSESNAILTISGWESTAIENHSGLVDNRRNFHGDPKLIAAKLAPVLPVAAVRASIVSAGDPVKYDVFFLNESGRPVHGKLRVALTDPKGAATQLAEFDVPRYVGNQFVYPVKEALETPPLALEGNYTLAIAADGDPTVSNAQVVHVYNSTAPDLPAARVGVIGDDSEAMLDRLRDFKQVRATQYQAGEKYDLIVAAAGLVSKKKQAMDTGAPSAAKATQEAEPEPILTDDVLQSIAHGTPLLAMAGDERHGRVLARQLADAGAFKFEGSVPTARASWMGNWIVVRSHPLYGGLPANEVMKGDYQIDVRACYGLRVDGPGVEVVAAYGRDHDRDIGAATFTCKLRGTPVVFQAVNGAHRVVEQRWLSNAITYLVKQ